MNDDKSKETGNIFEGLKNMLSVVQINKSKFIKEIQNAEAMLR